MAVDRTTEMGFSSARVVHAAMPPHEPEGYTSISDPFAIGVSFTGHSRAVVEDGLGRPSERSFAPGTCGIVGISPTAWLRVDEPSEAVEIHASPHMRASVAEETGVDWYARPDYQQPGQDPVIWGICARFRMAALGAAALEDLEAEALVHALLVHVAVRHRHARPLRRLHGRLDQRRLSRVTAFIESSLHAPPSLRHMADVAAMSPFHFQRLFRATTGLSPHDFVMARRLERARRMIVDTGAPVDRIASQLGFSDLTHFRRSFRRQFNAAPRDLRRI